jgi:D-lyxose ketol-isomerase
MNKINDEYKKRVLEMYDKAHIVLNKNEIENLEYTDFGLDNIEEEGLNLVIYVNNNRYCAKEMVLLPYQTCPEHLHPSINGRAGKQETFRCRWGKVYLYVEMSTNKEDIILGVPEKNKEYYTARKEYVLLPGEQYTILPNTKHWFKAGEEGAVVSEFSSSSDDASDVFTNPNIQRVAQDR